MTPIWGSCHSLARVTIKAVEASRGKLEVNALPLIYAEPLVSTATEAYLQVRRHSAETAEL